MAGVNDANSHTIIAIISTNYPAQATLGKLIISNQSFQFHKRDCNSCQTLFMEGGNFHRVLLRNVLSLWDGGILCEIKF